MSLTLISRRKESFILSFHGPTQQDGYLSFIMKKGSIMVFQVFNKK